LITFVIFGVRSSKYQILEGFTEIYPEQVRNLVKSVSKKLADFSKSVFKIIAHVGHDDLERVKNKIY